MKIHYYLLAASLLTMPAFAQETYENARIADTDLNGTARYVGMGGALEALGKGFASFLISLLRYLALIVPAAWLGIQIAGVTGIWTAFPVAEFLTAIAAAVIFAVIYHKNVSSIPS